MRLIRALGRTNGLAATGDIVIARAGVGASSATSTSRLRLREAVAEFLCSASGASLGLTVAGGSLVDGVGRKAALEAVLMGLEALSSRLAGLASSELSATGFGTAAGVIGAVTVGISANAACRVDTLRCKVSFLTCIRSIVD